MQEGHILSLFKGVIDALEKLKEKGEITKFKWYSMDNVVSFTIKLKKE